MQIFVCITTTAKAQVLTFADDHDVGCSRYHYLFFYLFFYILFNVYIQPLGYDRPITIFYIAGPWGALLAFILNGIICICVVGEFSEMFPVPNAIMEYVRHSFCGSRSSARNGSFTGRLRIVGFFHAPLF